MVVKPRLAEVILISAAIGAYEINGEQLFHPSADAPK
jgi:hypothetical protein